MSYGGQDGSQSLESHSDVKKMGSEEEVVIVPEDRHSHVPGEVEEGLWGQRESTSANPAQLSKATLSTA